jgi:hypothetical protein
MVRIVDEKGYPTTEFQLFWQKTVDAIEASFDGIEGALAAAGIALDAADAANTAAAVATGAAVLAQDAADATMAETSIVNSFISNFTAPIISAASTGIVTVATHDRVYGDSTLNPTVSVTGNTVATGQVNPALVRIFYDDPSRAGGVVTYQFTVDPATAPVQSGHRHSVGAVVIPAAGSSNGGYIRPPGFTESTD